MAGTESLSTAKKSNMKSGTQGKVQDKDLLRLPKQKLLEIHDLMVKARVLEERMIKIYKMGDAYFWIGGPGEEAFGVPLGLLVNKGKGHEPQTPSMH